MSALERYLPQVENHPLHRFIGVERIHAQDGKARIEITLGSGAVNPIGVFHGGVAYMLCDMACYSALLSVLADGENAVTHDIHVSLMRAAQLGERVVASGRVIRRGRQLAFMEAEIHCGERLLARATVTKSILTGEKSA